MTHAFDNYTCDTMREIKNNMINELTENKEYYKSKCAEECLNDAMLTKALDILITDINKMPDDCFSILVHDCLLNEEEKRESLVNKIKGSIEHIKRLDAAARGL